MKTENDPIIREGETAIDFIIAETDRLYIREFNIDDVDAVLDYSADAENTHFMELGPENRDGVVNFIHSRLIHQVMEDRLAYDLAVCLKSTGEMIGSVGLYLSKDRMQADLGYIFNKKCWGLGYCTEAAAKMLEFGFLQLDLHRITARCDSKNAASEAVMKRIGMRFEGEMKSSVYTRVGGRRQWRSEKHYALLQREFLKRMADGSWDGE